MAEFIRDEDVRRRVRLAQEFLDPGTFAFWKRPGRRWS
jgi:hypothetical protein